MAQWKVGLFGCFGNTALCCASHIAPVLVIGKVAESIDSNGSLWAVATLANPCSAPVYLRHKLRADKGIEGNFFHDMLAVWCCVCCAIHQMAEETGGFESYLTAPITQEMERVAN